MAEPSGPINGQNRVVEGLVSTGGVAGLKKGANASAVTGSAYQALDTVVGGAGTAGTPAPDVVTVQGIAGGTPLPVSGTVTTSGDATAANQTTEITDIGGLTDAAPASDTASASLNGRLQRIAQRLTSIIALLPTSLGTGGGLKVDGSGTPLPVSGTFYQATQPVSAASLPLPSGASQDGTDPVGTNAGTQAGSTTTGVGIRGWLSTLVGIFQSVGGKVQGLGTAGTPAGGVLTVQGANGLGVYDAAGTGAPQEGFTVILARNIVGGASSLAQYSYLSYAWDGAGTRMTRTPVIFHSAVVTASGNTAVWTPTSGKKFRLMRFMLVLTAEAKQATTGDLTVKFQDDTTDIGIGLPVYVPSAAIAAPIGEAWNSGWIDLGNGYLSTTANNVLNVNLSAALTGGEFGIMVAGTEE